MGCVVVVRRVVVLDVDLVLVVGRVVRVVEDRLVVGCVVVRRVVVLDVDRVLGRESDLDLVVVLDVFGRDVVLLRVVALVFAREATLFRVVAPKTLRLLRLEFLYRDPRRPLA